MLKLLDISQNAINRHTKEADKCCVALKTYLEQLLNYGQFKLSKKQKQVLKQTAQQNRIFYSRNLRSKQNRKSVKIKKNEKVKYAINNRFVDPVVFFKEIKEQDKLLKRIKDREKNWTKKKKQIEQTKKRMRERARIKSQKIYDMNNKK